MMSHQMTEHAVTWPDEIDAVLGGDHVIGLGYVTPAHGVVVTPVTNFALRDRARGRIAVNSSVGAWRKLDRIRRNPRVALAFHTRAHAREERPEYVLVQGRASFPWPPDRDSWYDEIGGNWNRVSGVPREVGPLWERWMSIYHWRVNVWIDVERVVTWPDLECRGEPAVHGAPLPAEPPTPQSAPKGGVGPRLAGARAARRLARLPNTLLGWVGSDGFPMVVPASVGATGERGIALTSAAGLPPGGRRAGLAAHRFTRGAIGQRQRIHTGWLDVGDGGAVYAPHTGSGYWMPPSAFVYKIAVGAETRRRLRAARRAGAFPA
jgi:hypothetical protein